MILGRKQILVTGGAGFIGSHTVVELIENGFEPIIIDDFRNSEELILDGIEQIVKENIKIHRVDLTDYLGVRRVFAVSYTHLRAHETQ